MTIPPELLTELRNQDDRNVPAPLHHLCQALLNRYQKSVQAILFYGSCLRADSELDGIVDLYVLVDSYQSFYDTPFPALMNSLLPPNVFYIEVPFEDRRVRAKYAILSVKDFLFIG